MEAATNAQIQPVYVLTDDGGRDGLVRLLWDAGVFNDPAMEYLPQFYEPRGGDVIPNPIAERVA